MINPKAFTQREGVNSLTGIKSSLGNLRKVVALTYLLYLANNKKSSIVYAESKGNGIALKDEYKSFIKRFLGNEEIIETIDDNPLLTSQIESLYVGLTLMFAFGRVSFENKSLSMTKERTGGIRYPKKIDFASNIITFDLMLSSGTDDSVKETLVAWLQDKQLNNDIEQRISVFLNISIENNLFKLRQGNNHLYFQTEGIYKSLNADNEVSLASDEIVGPTRILNSMLRENLIPWLNFKKSLVTANANNDFNIKEYSEIITTSLNIRDIKVDNNVEQTHEEDDNNSENKLLSLQKITYGAPGTGKSHRISVDTKGQAVIRTTFHPDSDYSTFVGAYKPTMTKVRKCIVIDKEEREIKPLAQNSEYENKIQYSFVKQAFLKAYLGAWKKYTEPKTDEEGKEVILPQFLVIEEINRGNCAQIFGDLFQLLDRQDNKFSSYPIEADADLQQEIANAFKNDPLYKLSNNIDVEGIIEDYTSNYADENGMPCTLSDDIQSGRVLLLPKNLYIWATMNTSDQSLFPIDSAFKRRWDWEYVRISEGRDKQNNNEPLRWYIAINEEQYDWWSFLNKINERIGSITSSEDKKLGYFFCKADDVKISAEKFVSKVCFYLWNDVFKDFGFGKKDQSAAFKKENGKDIAFDDFYTEDPETFKSKVNEDLLETFMQKLEVDTVAKRLEKENKVAENNNNAPQQNEVPTE